EGVPGLLDYLKKNGVFIALATVSNRKRAEEFLRQGEISAYFDHIVSGDMVTKSKPDPQIYEKAAEGLGLSCSDCIAVEDSYNGVRSAYAAGCRVIMVPDRDVPDEEMREKCYRIVENCARIIEILEG
ncbi:MAG: HAD-IA family hydrolase, partial [Alistipes sp.]|nr:HAD-IA family hydrolase [Alistipes sp.]